MRSFVLVLVAALAGGAFAASATPSEIVIKKPAYRWLWGGVGFHNSEATMTGVMTDEFRDERVLKTFREISPTYARVFAGYYNWTKSAMDSFADYYDATFRQANTTLYVVPGRMPVITKDFDVDRYCEEVATRLEYLIKRRNCTKIRYYAAANELSVGSNYAWFSQGHWDLYAEILRGLQRAFIRHDLDIGLMAPDSSGYDHLQDIDWAITNVNDQTEVYCWHLYNRGDQPGDRAAYDRFYAAITNLVTKCNRKEKRLSLGEYGFYGPRYRWYEKAMIDDSHGSFKNAAGKFARETAISRVEMALTAMNGGAMHAVSWTMVDYPDPFIRENGDTPEDKLRYDVARFSGHGLDIRYNKNGLFRWCDDERDYSAYPDLYTMGYLAKLFRKGARVLRCETGDCDLRLGAVTNPDGSCSIAVINWGAAKEVRIKSEHRLTKPLRVYEYDSAKPPVNEFNDLQPAKGVITATDDAFVAKVAARSLTFFTTDYTDREPSPVVGIRVTDGILSWTASRDVDHVYYRVYRDGRQIASTVAISRPVDGGGDFKITSVDRWGNEGKREVTP